MQFVLFLRALLCGRLRRQNRHRGRCSHHGGIARHSEGSWDGEYLQRTPRLRARFQANLQGPR